MERSSAAAAALATLDAISAPGFHKRLNAVAESFYARAQAVLNKYGAPAIVAGRASFWQILFASDRPRNQIDVLVSDMNRSKALDLALLKRGQYVLPNVRRFVSGVHTDVDFEETLAALDEICATGI